jgi:hypothetical protein
MIAFCLSIHHLWGRTLAKHYQDACAVTYADNGYIKAKLSLRSRCSRTSSTFSVKTLAWTSIIRPRFSSRVSRLPRRTLPHSTCSLLIPPSHTSVPLLAPTAFVDDIYIGLGVPIGTDAFVQHFVKKKCQEIMDDVDKLDNIQDGFIHYQLVRFWQATRLQYLNGQIDLANQNVLQQQHVDWKISNTLLKKGTRDAYKTWNQQDHTWVNMRLHESHDEARAR